MADKTLVLKFGGTSVADLCSWQEIERVVRRRNTEADRVVVVVSALSQVSNTIEDLMTAPVFAAQKFQQLVARHQSLATEMALTDTAFLTENFTCLKNLLSSVFSTDKIEPSVWARAMSYGEIISSLLGLHFLTACGLDMVWLSAANLLLSTEANYTDTSAAFRPRLHEKDLLAQHSLFITQGFIARNRENATVLLGRGGSDTSATLLAAGLNAERCELWSNVPGFYSTDPKIIPQAKLILALTYEEAQEVAFMGAKVLHPRAIAPLMADRIEMRLHSLHDPQAEGTVISDRTQTTAGTVIKAVSVKKNVLLIQMESLKMWRQAGFLADIFACFKKNSFSVDLISTSEASVCVSLDKIAAYRVYGLDILMRELEKFCLVKKVSCCASISLIGKNIRSMLPELSPVFALFDRQTVHLVSQSANDLNLTFVVDQEQSDKIVHKIHNLLFGERIDSDIFGASWLELKTKTSSKPSPRPWWHSKQQELLQLAEGAPLYVYDLQQVDVSLQKLLSIRAVDRIFYTVKANNHASILSFLARAGIGFECVSHGELHYLEKTLPRLDHSKVLFTPNFCQRDEYVYALERGYEITIDNLYVLQNWGAAFAGRKVFLRIDPGFGKGHHKHVVTGGFRSKFGISPQNIANAETALHEYGIEVKGLHIHAGSGILAPYNWQQRAETLLALHHRFPTVKVLNLGGGFGIPEHPKDIELDFSVVDASLRKVKEKYPQLELWIEPGRYLVAQAGVLLARVTQLKHKDRVNFVGVNTGMNSLIRPALYDSYHEIFNLTRLDETHEMETVEVVGPICETADNFGHARKMPVSQEGDIVLIAGAGAYGATMASHYNLRSPAQEIVLGPDGVEQ